jgi:hypothetical protein
MTGPKDIVIAVLAGLIIAFSIHAVIRKLQMDNLKTTVNLYEQREKNWKQELNDCSDVVSDLQSKINLQNDYSETAAEMGVEARRAQERADIYARRLAASEERLQRLIDDQRRFESLVVEADVCETYELVLLDIAGQIQ